MEKYIKPLSIVMLVLTTVFFLDMFGAANAEGTNLPQFLQTFLIIGANLLLYVVPLMYMAVFAISMTSIFKRVLNSQSTAARKKFDKFPILWFILATISFIAYYIFVSAVFNA